MLIYIFGEKGKGTKVTIYVMIKIICFCGEPMKECGNDAIFIGTHQD